MSELCSMGQSDHPAEFFCSCGVLLCDQHLPDHIRNHKKHSLCPLWSYLSQQEINNLKDSLSCLDEYLLLKSNLLDNKFQREEQKFLDSMRRSKDIYLREKEFQLEKREDIGGNAVKYT